MHRSRIGIVLVDHPESKYDATLAFWSAVQGVTPVQQPGPYARVGHIGSLNFEVQRTGEGTPSRIHLDIETDDIAAEVERVVALGATIIESGETITILEDPGGLVFCVVGIQTDDRFEADVRTWE